MSSAIIGQLAPTGVLRAGVNMGNFLLVTSRAENGDPAGVSPSMAKAIADRLGVPVKYVPFARPNEVADAADTNTWDIALIGAEPQRAAKISFTAAYCEIEATYLVPAGSPITSMAQVDKPGIRIGVSAGAAYALWLERNIKQATLIQVPGGGNAALQKFIDDKMDVFAGLRPGLLGDVEKLPGARILDGQFMAVQQAIGTAKQNDAAFAFLKDFVEEAKRSGLVAGFIEQHKVRGLSVAPLA
jgi:polar amino acid transport system substrate-binding protein